MEAQHVEALVQEGCMNRALGHVNAPLEFTWDPAQGDSLGARVGPRVGRLPARGACGWTPDERARIRGKVVQVLRTLPLRVGAGLDGSTYEHWRSSGGEETSPYERVMQEAVEMWLAGEAPEIAYRLCRPGRLLAAKNGAAECALS